MTKNATYCRSEQAAEPVTAPKTRTVEGWVVKYNSFSKPMTLPNGAQVFEVFKPGAFAASIAAINAGNAVAQCNIEHVKDNALTLLANTNINMHLEDRPEGVYVTINLLDDSVSEDVFCRIKEGLVTGLSVEFDKAGLVTTVEPRGDGNYNRIITYATLSGLAITAAPLYTDAQIQKAVEDGSTVYSRSQATKKTEIEQEVSAFINTEWYSLYMKYCDYLY